MHYTPRIHRILAEAEAIADRLGQTYVGTEHVLLALMSDVDGYAGQLLDSLGVRDEAIRTTESELRNRRESEVADIFIPAGASLFEIDLQNGTKMRVHIGDVDQPIGGVSSV